MGKLFYLIACLVVSILLEAMILAWYRMGRRTKRALDERQGVAHADTQDAAAMDAVGSWYEQWFRHHVREGPLLYPLFASLSIVPAFAGAATMWWPHFLDIDVLVAALMAMIAGLLLHYHLAQRIRRRLLNSVMSGSVPICPRCLQPLPVGGEVVRCRSCEIDVYISILRKRWQGAARADALTGKERIANDASDAE